MHYSASVISINNFRDAIERVEWMIDDLSTGRRDGPIGNFEAELDNG